MIQEDLEREKKLIELEKSWMEFVKSAKFALLDRNS